MTPKRGSMDTRTVFLIAGAVVLVTVAAVCVLRYRTATHRAERAARLRKQEDEEPPGPLSDLKLPLASAAIDLPNTRTDALPVVIIVEHLDDDRRPMSQYDGELPFPRTQGQRALMFCAEDIGDPDRNELARMLARLRHLRMVTGGALPADGGELRVPEEDVEDILDAQLAKENEAEKNPPDLLLLVEPQLEYGLLARPFAEGVHSGIGKFWLGCRRSVRSKRPRVLPVVLPPGDMVLESIIGEDDAYLTVIVTPNGYRLRRASIAMAARIVYAASRRTPPSTAREDELTRDEAAVALAALQKKEKQTRLLIACPLNRTVQDFASAVDLGLDARFTEIIPAIPRR